MKIYINRKRFVVYEPNFKAGGEVRTLHSWYQVKKLCNKWGVGCEVSVCRLQGGTRRGSLSCWDVERELEWV